MEQKMMDRIPVPLDTHKITREIFAFKKIVPSKLSKNPPWGFEIAMGSTANFQDTQYYSRKTPGGTVTYCIPQALLNHSIPSVSLMRRAYFASLWFALECGSPCVSFSKSEKLRRLGYERSFLRKGGKLFKDIELAEKGLSSVIFHYKNNKRGKDFREIILSPLYSKYVQQGKAKGSVITVSLNREYIGDIDLKTGQVEGQFVKLPMQYVMDRNLAIYELNIRLKALEFLGLPKLSIYGNTLLDWAGLPESLSARKKRREEIFLLAQRVLEEMGFKRENLKMAAQNANGRYDDFRGWKVVYIPPTEPSFREKGYKTMLSASEEKFIDDFVEWQFSNKSTKTKGEIEKMITNTVKAYGLETCMRLYREANHPIKFWRYIQDLKQKRMRNACRL